MTPPLSELGDLVRRGPPPDGEREWQDALDDVIRAIAGLTAVDGATLLTDRHDLLAFGAKITRREGFPVIERVAVTEPIEGTDAMTVHPTRLGGTRHLSAAQFVQDQKGSLALVASQDGRFTVFAWSPCEKMVYAHRVETLLLLRDVARTRPLRGPPRSPAAVDRVGYHFTMTVITVLDRPVAADLGCRRTASRSCAVNGMRDILTPFGSLADWQMFADSWERARARHATWPTADATGSGAMRSTRPNRPARSGASRTSRTTSRSTTTRCTAASNAGSRRSRDEVGDSQTLATILAFCRSLFGELAPDTPLVAHRSPPVPDRGACRRHRDGRRRKGCTATASTTCWCCSSTAATSPAA